MSKNIESDMRKLEVLTAKRAGAVSRIHSMNWNQFGTDYIDKPRLQLVSETLRVVSDYEYFNVDQSAFETFKSSGLLRNIQGYDIESLIFRYYNLAEEIARKEADYNQELREAFSELSKEGFEAMVFVMYPDYVDDDAQLTALQSQIKEIIVHPTTLSIYAHAYDRAPEIIIRYENLSLIGNEIIRIVQSGQSSLEDIQSDTLDQLFDLDGNEGYSKVLTEGAMVSQFYEAGSATAGDQDVQVAPAINETILSLPSAEWAVFYLRNRSDAFSQKPAKDFSRYRSVKVTLKGEIGGEQIWLAIKDDTDPDDGSETQVPVTLQPDWTSYEFPLDTFSNAALENIFVPMMFISRGDAQTFSIREVEFLK